MLLIQSIIKLIYIFIFMCIFLLFCDVITMMTDAVMDMKYYSLQYC